MAVNPVMASRRRQWREGAGKRAGRLSSLALLSSPAALATVTAVATAQARRPGSSDGDGEADVERATKQWLASEQWPSVVARRASEHWQMKAIRLVPHTSSASCCKSTLTQQQRQKYLGHTVSVCKTKMREPLAKQYRSKSSSNNVIDKQNL